MKKWLYLTVLLAAFGLLSRLPHPSRDLAKLDPVRLVYIHMEADELHMETDTGGQGSGPTLTEALDDMKDNADAEIFLDTAEYLVLDPAVPITEEIFARLHPTCKVFYAAQRPDLEKAAQYLAVHPPDLTLAHLRAQYAGIRN